MKISISDKRKISSVQEGFNKLFPYLRLEFFNVRSRTGKGTEKKNMIIPDDKTVGECRRIHKSSSITITARMKVSQLEKIFLEDYGLSVQVFRQSGRVWLETTMTDDWTLAEQNKQGEELTRHTMKKEKTLTTDDYHEQE
ncbi:MAG: hypothetical protein JJE25_13180 [Bacteroidia bacterium]|nr:hypothetical protein [Bacteroidia bacterium]